MPPNRTKPHVWPAVSGTIILTAQLAGEDDHLSTQLRRALTTSVAADADLEWRYAYAHENQYGESGENWKGRKPADSVDTEDFMSMLVIDDQIGPALGREVKAQFAKAPEWDAVQGKAKLDAGAETVTFLSEWHDEAGLNEAAKKAAFTRLWAGRMVGRVYVPAEYQERLAAGAANRPTTLAEALELVHVQAVDPREGGPIRDAHGRVLGYWYRYIRQPDGGESQTVLEVHTPQNVLTYLQGSDGRLTPDGEVADNPYHDSQQPGRVRRAEYLMWHTDREEGSAITLSVRDAQDRLNVVNTYMGRNDDQTGYRQFIVSNAEQPRNKKGEAVPFPMGPGIALNVRGLKRPHGANDSLGDERVQDRHAPTWEIVEPLNPEHYHIPSINRWKGSLLEKLDQLWTLSPDVQVSGESKRQSRKPFDQRVTFGAQDSGRFIAWALRSALMLAGQILGRVGEYRDVTFQPKMYLDVDAVNLEELRVKLAMWQAGALTLVSLLEATPGVTDAAKEAKEVEEGSGTSADAEARRKALERLTGGGSADGTSGGDG